MYNEPFFSIIIPSFNRASFLPETIKSVLGQTYQYWECLIIDDGSTDNTREVVKGFKDPRIKYFLKKNEERSIARNYGIDKSKGEYVCFLDSDDLFYPFHLASLNSRIEEENFPVALFNTGMNENRKGKNIPRPIYKPEEYKHPVYFIWEKFMLPSSVCIHKNILKENKFPPQFNVWEDTHLWLRIAVQYPFFQIENVTTQWNVHGGGTVEKAFNKVNGAHVKNYLKCISHLFIHYRDLIEHYIDEKEMRAYQVKKLKMFLSISFNKKQYRTFSQLYFYGTFAIERAEVNRYAKALLKGKLIQKINFVKAAIK